MYLILLTDFNSLKTVNMGLLRALACFHFVKNITKRFIQAYLLYNVSTFFIFRYEYGWLDDDILLRTLEK